MSEATILLVRKPAACGMTGEPQPWSKDLQRVLERGRANKLALSAAQISRVEDRAQDRLIDLLQSPVIEFTADDDGHFDRSGHVMESLGL